MDVGVVVVVAVLKGVVKRFLLERVVVVDGRVVLLRRQWRTIHTHRIEE
jgi:hypothetical protein